MYSFDLEGTSLLSEFDGTARLAGSLPLLVHFVPDRRRRRQRILYAPLSFFLMGTS